jgi:hypothetical protein
MLQNYSSTGPLVASDDTVALRDLRELYLDFDRERLDAEKRVALDEAKVASMRRPVGLRDAYGLMGMLLGLLAPAAIFWKFFNYGLTSDTHGRGVGLASLLLLAMNLVCAFVGDRAGDLFRRNLTLRRVGRAELEYEPATYISWPKFLIALPVVAAGWGLLTGALGGVICFGVGVAIGPIFAIPVGVAGMSTFGLLHRWLQSDGMIELSHLLIAALGVALAITALILAAPISHL